MDRTQEKMLFYKMCSKITSGLVINVSIIIMWNISLVFGRTFGESNSLHDLPDIVCGDTARLYNDCFKNVSPLMSDLFTSVKIPISSDEIKARCRLFDRGMACTNKYMEKCITPDERKLLENELYGARKLFGYLCNDLQFQKEFLKHKPCFFHIQKDWEKCSNTFVHVLKEEISTVNVDNMRFMHFCCTRYAYEQCVNRQARYKCRDDSAIFVTKIAKILSTERQFINCDKVEGEFCSRGNNIHVFSASLRYATLLLVYFLIFY